MQLASWVHTFFHDDKVLVVLLLIALDFILGVSAALYTKTFKMSYIAAFARDDILEKVVPYFALYAAALADGHMNIIIPGVDLGIIAGSVYALIVAAMVASILKSLKDLKVLSGSGGVLGLLSS